MKGNVWSVAVVAILLVSIGALTHGYSNALHSETKDNESIQVDYSQKTQVDKNVTKYGDDEQIWNKSGYKLQENQDYTWNSSTGEVNWINTSHTKDGETANITYSYYYRSNSTKTAGTTLQTLNPLIGVFLLVGGGAAAVSMMNRVGRGW